MENRKGKKVTKKDYDLVKTLTKAGVSVAKTSEITGRSYMVVRFLNKANSIEEYEKISKEYWDKKEADRNARLNKEANTNGETKIEVVTDEQAEVLKQILREVTKMNKNLETLGNFVVNTVNKGKLEKKGFFQIR